MNMSYCRFENTYNDLVDCIENMGKQSENDRDERYRERLLLLMKSIIDSGEVDEILEEIEDNRHK
ncbi:hypothetical protein UFOVP331_111 [uncultured Caudovirales phage]|uniref:Uncharacterized protein n=1 Tax=uncultured Caudovirales phage TaxID=2100421 RepID=A0A6J5LWT4_9CAUD|nr:hypothetical protein UFOVP331_111 [uncultured Caudovirales phage]